MTATFNHPKDKEFLIVGLARNCSRTISNDIKRIQSVFAPLGKLNYLVIESDSTDGTPETLNTLKNNNPSFDFISLGNLAVKHPKRTERIAFCRNKYLQEIKENPKYKSIHYVVVCDLDQMTDLLTSESIQTCFTRTDWAVCTANQRGPYYDIWALRHPEWNPGDCWQQYYFLSRYISSSKAMLASIYSKMIHIKENSNWIEVDSAFGGLAIYHKKVIENKNYIGLNNRNEEVCEHVSVHNEIRKEGHRIYINPSLINTGVTEHSKRPSLVNEAKSFLRTVLKK